MATNFNHVGRGFRNGTQPHRFDLNPHTLDSFIQQDNNQQQSGEPESYGSNYSGSPTGTPPTTHQQTSSSQPYALPPGHYFPSNQINMPQAMHSPVAHQFRQSMTEAPSFAYSIDFDGTSVPNGNGNMGMGNNQTE